jgi:YidC/Oxa1 family membrane protein insertase
MDTRRAILWVIFSLSLLMLWDAYMRHTGQGSMFGTGVTTPTTPPQSGAGSAAPTGAAGNPGVPATTGAILSAPTAAVNGSISSATPVSGTPAPSGDRVTLRNKDIELEIDTVGARIVRAKLLTQESDAYPDGRVTLFDQSPDRKYEAQTGLIGAAGSATNFPNHTTPFKRVSGQEAVSGPERRTTLAAELGGIKLTKSFELDPEGYSIKVSHTVQNTGADSLTPLVYLQLMRDGDRAPGESKFYQTFIGPAIYTEEGKFQKIDFSDVEKNKANHVKSATNGWLGIVQHYFVAAWVPKNDTPREFYTRKVDNNLYSVGLIQPLNTIAPGAQQSHEAVLFAGPQLQRTLEQLAPGLDLVVDYGWLTFLAQPIYWLLEKLHGIVANWGWAIVLLTIIIKLIFYPLSAASYKSMAKMKAVSPRLMKLREVYANDKAKLNQAMMEMYKTEKINPLGGCLPVVIQIPVFLALYWVLLASVEMRNAPWIGWINDLSVPDPYFILPVVMAVTMFIQTKLNPPPPDPLQAKVMMFMPIVFSVFFFFFPAGLVLYWLVNNVISIAQQWFVMRQVAQRGALKKA